MFYSVYQPYAAKDYLLHIYSGDFHLIKENIPVQKFSTIDKNIAITLLTGDAGSHLITDNKLIFVPAIYAGSIYKYDFSYNNQGIPGINLKERIKGKTYTKAVEQFLNKDKNFADATLTLNGEEFQFLVHNQSKGLFQLNDGRIVHFTYIESKNGKERIFGVEVYDENMNPIGYVTLKTVEFNPENSFLLQWKVAWKDNQDRFYIIDESGIPTIRVVKLEIGGDI